MGFFKNLFSSTKSKADQAVSILDIQTVSSAEKYIHLKVPSKKIYTLRHEVDAFIQEECIKFKTLASYGNDKLLLWADDQDFVSFDTGIRTVNGNHLLSFATYQKTLKFNKQDKVLFLFEDQEIKEYTFNQDGYKIEKAKEGVIIETTVDFPLVDFEKFATFRLLKWRLVSEKNEKKATGTLSAGLQNDIHEMFRVYRFYLNSLKTNGFA